MSTGEHGQADGAGRLLAGRYRVTGRLGRGGMGVVWKAVDEVLGREVAVKELRAYTDAAGPELADLRLRMQREARAAARVRHTGVIVVHDIAEVDGRPLIVMELVDGPSLDDVLRDRGPLDAREAARIGAKVMDALAAAHRVGVLHRDVKPGNILLDRSGRVVLADFGIATMDDPGDGSATHLTRSGELVGSLDYLAPERAQGAAPGPASDIWALGATLYAAVEGASPFRRTSTFSTLTAIVTDPLPEPRRAGPLAPVLQQLLDKRPRAARRPTRPARCSRGRRTGAARTRRRPHCGAVLRPRPRARRRSAACRRYRRDSGHHNTCSPAPPGPTRTRAHRSPARLPPPEPPAVQERPPRVHQNSPNRARAIQPKQGPIRMARGSVRRAQRLVRMARHMVRAAQSPARMAQGPLSMAQSQACTAQGRARMARDTIRRVQGPSRTVRALVRTPQSPAHTPQSPARSARAPRASGRPARAAPAPAPVLPQVR